VTSAQGRKEESQPPPVPKQVEPAPNPLAKEVTNSIGMELVLIPRGKFLMGAPKEEEGRRYNEDQHEVGITQPFYLGKYEVTQREYAQVMGNNPSWFTLQGGAKRAFGLVDTHRFPVEKVSWKDAVAFCRHLTERPEERRAGRVYRLPTEAEWEYACRGGAREPTPFHFGRTISSDQANINLHLHRTTAVGSYKPNAFGLYDMHGNVWEWCQDWYGEDFDKESPKQDPTGPESGTWRVLRGGSWFDIPGDCRAASRNANAPGNHYDHFGFRVACGPGGGT
jgi:formylglycine-generating enzyme required for sulfatase activity